MISRSRTTGGQCMTASIARWIAGGICILLAPGAAVPILDRAGAVNQSVPVEAFFGAAVSVLAVDEPDAELESSDVFVVAAASPVFGPSLVPPSVSDFFDVLDDLRSTLAQPEPLN